VGEPPVSVGQALGGVLPGLVVGAGVGVAVGAAVVGATVAVRVAVGAAVVATAVAAVGLLEIRTVSSGAHAARSAIANSAAMVLVPVRLVMFSTP